VASVAADQVNVYRAKWMDLAMHFVNQANEYTKGGNLAALCYVRSPDENNVLLAVGGDEGAVVVLSLAECRAVALLKGHTAPITRIIAHPTRQNCIASLASGDGVRVWDIALETCLCHIDLSNNVQFVGRGLAFDNSSLLVVSVDKALRFYAWEEENCKMAKQLQTSGLVNDFCLVKDSAFFCVLANNTLIAMDSQGPLSIGLDRSFKVNKGASQKCAS